MRDVVDCYDVLWSGNQQRSVIKGQRLGKMICITWKAGSGWVVVVHGASWLRNDVGTLTAAWMPGVCVIIRSIDLWERGFPLAWVNSYRASEQIEYGGRGKIISPGASYGPSLQPSCTFLPACNMLQFIRRQPQHLDTPFTLNNLVLLYAVCTLSCACCVCCWLHSLLRVTPTSHDQLTCLCLLLKSLFT